MVKQSIEHILELLYREYGFHERTPGLNPLSVLIQTILSQNTSDLNSGRAFELLLATFPTWEKLADADISHIASTIRIGGLNHIKAVRIRQILRDIRQKTNKLELNFIDELPLDEAREWLLRLPGVGMKTANCVLLFASGRPALPVDTHIFRVTKRLGLIASGVSVEKAHWALEAMVVPEDIYQFHISMIEHGRKVCHSRCPVCNVCVLKKMCPSYGKLVVRTAVK